MSRNIVKAKLDVIFKKLFTEHKDLLHDFISEMLDIPPEKMQDIVVTNPELPPETITGKFSRLDLKLQTDEQLINVEIQVRNDPMAAIPECRKRGGAGDDKNTDVPVMKDAVRVIYDMSDDTRNREIARLREKAMHDEASALGNARREGKAEGIEEGMAKVIDQMRKSGMTEDQIKQILDS